MLPQITARCPLCHHRAPVQGLRFGHHGRGRKGCSASGSAIPQVPGFAFTTKIGTAATRKTSVTIAADGVSPVLVYEFEGPDHRQRASEFADELTVPVFSGQQLLERLQVLEDTFPGVKTVFRASLAFCVAILQLIPRRNTV